MRCVTERHVGEIVVLDLASRNMLGDLNRELSHKVEGLLAAGRRAFVLNLDGVSSLDSHGLGDLAGARELAARQGASLKLCNVHERVAHPLRIMNLSHTFDTFATEDDALRSFESGMRRDSN